MSNGAGRRSPDEVGARIKALRTERQLTLAELAEASELTRGFLSKLERGQTAVSVASLLKLADAFGLPLTDLFEPSMGFNVTRFSKEAAPPPGHLAVNTPLSPAAERRIEAVRTTIPAGSHQDLGPLGEGQVSFIHIISGVLEIQAPNGVVHLQQGDSVTISTPSGIQMKSPGRGVGTVFVQMNAPAGSGEKRHE